jgi:hypothetical protein
LESDDILAKDRMVYRFHTDLPIPFQNYFKMTIEHGHANHRSDKFSRVA